MSRTRLPCPITLDDLTERYVEGRQSMAQLARDLGTSEYHVKEWLKRARVKRRGRAEANRISGPIRKHSRTHR